MVTRAYRWIIGLVLAAIAAGFAGQMVMAQDANAITFETVGTIEAMDTASITVHGQLIDITGAEIKTALEIGLAVKVEGTLLADGRLSAREVKSTETGIQPDEGEFVIAWPGSSGTTFIIGGVAFDISNAEIENGLVTGDLVRIHATLSDTGIWIVREVRAAFDDDDDNNNDNNDNVDDNDNDNDDNSNNNDNNGGVVDGELEFTGTLDEIGDGFIIVSGARINITSAEIRDQLIVGLLVKVHVRVVNGELVAREVELAFQDDDNDNNDDNDNGNDNDDDGNGNDNVVGTCPPTLPAGWTTYTIQPGDTLSSIASRADTSLENLIIANCIDNPRLMVVGSTIFVPRTPDPISDNDNDDNNNDNDDDDDDNGNDNDDNGNNNDNGNDDGDNGNNNDNGDDDDDGGNGNGNDNENRGGDDDDD